MIGLRVLTIGTFDLFHAGHERLISRAARLGLLVVGVNSDRFVEEYKGRPPAEDEDTRFDRVGAHHEVQWNVRINDGPGYDLIRAVKPTFLVVGSDWLEKDYLEQIRMTPEELFEKLGISLVFVPRTPGVSSSGLRV